MERKWLKLKLADAGAEGVIKGHLSVKSNVDLAQEVVAPGAFKRTLAASKGDLPMLWSHKPEEPIGKWTKMVEDEKGLYVEGQINLEVERGREIFALLKQGAIKGLSIGYDVVRDRIDKGVRHLLEIKLWEGSVVTFPCNPLATVEDVKAMGSKFLADFDAINDRNQVHAAMDVAFGTLRDVLFMATWTQEMEDDEAAAYVDTSLAQFSAAMAALFAKRRALAQADMAPGEKGLAMQYERIVSSMHNVAALLGDTKALLEKAQGKSDSGEAAHSDEPAETGPAADTLDPRSDAHSDDSEDFAVLKAAIRSATPS